MRYDVSNTAVTIHEMQEVKCCSRERKRRRYEKENVLLRETHVCRWPNAHQLHNHRTYIRQHCRRRSSIGPEEGATEASAPESQCGRGGQSSIFCRRRQ